MVLLLLHEMRTPPSHWRNACGGLISVALCVVALMSLIVVVPVAAHMDRGTANGTTSYTMFGLHNNGSDSPLEVANAFNAWIHSQTSTHDAKGSDSATTTTTTVTGAPRIVSVLAVTHFLMGGDGTARDEHMHPLLASMVAIWDNGSIPLLQLLPCQDPAVDPAGFASAMVGASSQAGGRMPSYNAWLFEAHPAGDYVDRNVSQLLQDVLLPFLFPDSNNSTSVVERLASSRRLYLEFAPGFNSMRYPWGASYEFAGGNGSASGTLVQIRNSYDSYVQLWDRIIGNGIQAGAQSWLEAWLRDAATLADSSHTGHDDEAIRLSRFLQVVWTASATQISQEWVQDGSLVASWLPSWPCPNSSVPSLCNVTVCGPDWFAVTAVALHTDGPGGTNSTALVAPLLAAVKALSDQVLHSMQWCRAPELWNVSVPVALLHVGAASEESAIDGGGPQRKDEWIHMLLNLAVDDAYIRLVVPQNTRYFANNPLGAPPLEAHLQLYSFHDGSCCDGTDLANGAAVMDQVSAVLIDAEAAGLLVAVQCASSPSPVPEGAGSGANGWCAVDCRRLSDETFMGALYNGAPCACAPLVTPSAPEGWWARVLKDPIVIAGALVFVLVALGVGIAWGRRRVRATTMKQQRRRMILGRYVVTSILQHYRQFSSVLVAYDTEQCMDVVVKQYVLVSDNAIALANNEIEKYRACTGFPHLVQLVQCTFAWKKKHQEPLRQAGGLVNDSRAGVEARLLQDPSSRTLVEAERALQASQSTNNNAVLNDVNAAKTPFAIVVMKKYASGDLKAMIDRVKEDSGGDRSLDPHTGFGYADCVSLLTQLCIALHTIHTVLNPADAMLHRDVKPENIFLERRPLRGKPKEHVYIAYLGDFGCAVYESQLRSSTTPSAHPTTTPRTDISKTFLTTKAVGTSKYMPPEARRGAYCTAGDIWALGCVMLYATVRHAPADFCQAMIDDKFVSEARSTLSGHALFPAWLTDIILHRMLHVDPTCRSTAEELLKTIRREVTASPVVDAALLHRRPIVEVFGDPSPTEAEARGSVRYVPMDEEASQDGRPPPFSDGRFSLVGGADAGSSDDEHLILDDEDIAETSDRFVV